MKTLRILCFLCFIALTHTHNLVEEEKELVTISTSNKVIANVAENFIGVTFDYGNICNRTANGSVVGSCVGATTLKLSSQLAKLASMNGGGLQRPGVLRIGGSAQDSVLFLGEGEHCPLQRQPNNGIKRNANSYQCSQDKPNGEYGHCFSTQRLKELCTFAKQSDLKLVIGLNACMGRNAINASMNISALQPFLSFAASCEECLGAILSFELGNELDLHVYHNCDGVEPEALGKDLKAISTLNKQLFAHWPVAQRPTVAGPDIAAFTGGTLMPDENTTDKSNYYTRFLKGAGSGTVHALTFHQYVYCNMPGNNTVIDLTCLSRLSLAGKAMKQIASDEEGMQVWVGESSNVWTGGKPNVSDVFFDGFYYAEQLRAMSLAGISVVIRQDLLGMYYQLLSYPSLTPKPSYWVAYLWKSLIGERVYDVTLSSNVEEDVPESLHVSVHSGAHNSTTHVIVLINFHVSTNVSVALKNNEFNTAESLVMAHILTGPIYSDKIQLNGKKLALTPEGDLPKVEGVAVIADDIVIPCKSIVFLQVTQNKGANLH
eukprot:m.43671 g.43671  ORF g.43671 m.43671 type:complete len:545 (-) comp9992_c0_seq1:24-1658(-)